MAIIQTNIALKMNGFGFTDIFDNKQLITFSSDTQITYQDDIYATIVKGQNLLSTSGLVTSILESTYMGNATTLDQYLYIDNINFQQNGTGNNNNPFFPVNILQDSDFITGSSYSDYIIGYNGNDTINGVMGNDTIFGDEGNDSLTGGNGDDILLGGNNNDTIYGSLGNDYINGNQDNDSVYGGNGDDIVRGGKQSDGVFGEDGNDFVAGDLDDDQVYGGNGNDTLRGGKDNDALFGESGNDIIYGDKGDDILWGGEGSDTFVFNSTSGQDTIKDYFLGTDRIHISHDIFTSAAQAVSAFNNSVLDLGNNNYVTLENVISLSENDIIII